MRALILGLFLMYPMDLLAQNYECHHSEGPIHATLYLSTGQNDASFTTYLVYDSSSIAIVRGRAIAAERSNTEFELLATREGIEGVWELPGPRSYGAVVLGANGTAKLTFPANYLSLDLIPMTRSAEPGSVRSHSFRTIALNCLVL